MAEKLKTTKDDALVATRKMSCHSVWVDRTFTCRLRCVTSARSRSAERSVSWLTAREQ